MITGFNTDVEHDGIVYHVQTEDKGLDTPLMLTLVYTRGEILASKRVRYDDLVEAGFDEKVLAERLLRQHKLICAAVRAGRLDELKKMTERDSASRTSSKVEAQPVPSSPVTEPVQKTEPATVKRHEEVKFKPPPALKTEPKLPSATQRSTTPSLPASKSKPGPPVVRPQPITASLLNLVLVDEKIYRGGDRVMLRVRVESGENQRQVIPGAEVMVKILGSTFRPLIYQSQSGPDGIAFFKTELPHFRSGRAAILIRATAGGVEAELRRIIQQG